jgi:hypothetical protein
MNIAEKASRGTLKRKAARIFKMTIDDLST